MNANKNNPPNPAANMEQNISHAPLGAQGVTRFDTPVSIHVRSYRNRLADADGISAKAAIDGLVHCGLLKDDSPEYVKSVTYSQEKTSGQEYTEIIISEDEIK